MLDETDLVVLALTSRVVPSPVPPLSAGEFWPLARAGDLLLLQGKSAEDVASDLSIPGELADRISRLLERGTALALALEQFEHSGIWTVTGGGEHYPARLIDRLGDGAPPAFHGVGDLQLLQVDGVGVVGSRDVDADGAHVAREVAYAGVDAGLPVVSGAARGVDQQAMNAAFERGGQVVGVIADSLERTVAKPSTRQAVAGGQICLVTPYTPTAPFSAGNAMGRNKVIYALSRCVVVVRSEEGTGGTWAGATEALRRKFTTVVSWTGIGSAAGNVALLTQGAVELGDMAELAQIIAADPTPPSKASRRPSGDQMSLF